MWPIFFEKKSVKRQWYTNQKNDEYTRLYRVIVKILELRVQISEKLRKTDKNRINLKYKIHSFSKSVGAKSVPLEICGCSCTNCTHAN